MSEMTLDDIAKAMRDIDFTMLVTRSEGGELAARPMSNNRDVEYQGDSYFFTSEETRSVTDISHDARVAMTLQGEKGLLGKPPLFISVEGHAELIRDKSQFEAHWTKELDRWFEQGVDTPGVVMIKVRAVRLHYWQGMDSGEITI